MTEEDPIDPRVRDYIAGRLSAEDEAALLAEAERTPALDAELQLARGLRAIAETEVPNAEFGWARLSRAIEDERKAAPANDNPLSILRTQRFSALQAAGLVAAAVLVWQIAAVPLQNKEAPDAQYAPVSEAQAEFVSVVAFTAEARMEEITRLLQEVDADIVSGPGALGLYRVRFKDAEARERGAEQLEAQSELVESVTGD